MDEPLEISIEDFDRLPFGAIRIDHQGTILEYNDFESRLSGRAKADVVGRNFFSDVAPCTKVKGFYGVLRDAEAHPPVNLQFPFTFNFDTPRRVFIHIVPGPERTYWIFVSESVSDRSLTSMLLRAGA